MTPTWREGKRFGVYYLHIYKLPHEVMGTVNKLQIISFISLIVLSFIVVIGPEDSVARLPLSCFTFCVL